jgi:hypothetical protein
MSCQAGTFTVRCPGVPPRITLRSDTSLRALVSYSTRSGFAVTCT